jgi:hypothetical protein
MALRGRGLAVWFVGALKAGAIECGLMREGWAVIGKAQRSRLR